MSGEFFFTQVKVFLICELLLQVTNMSSPKKHPINNDRCVHFDRFYWKHVLKATDDQFYLFDNVNSLDEK